MDKFGTQLTEHGYVPCPAIDSGGMRRRLGDSVYFFDLRFRNGFGFVWELTLSLNPFGADSLNVASKYSSDRRYDYSFEGVKRAEADLLKQAREEFLLALIKRLQLPELADEV